MKHLSISHSIFLTTQERENLGTQPTSIETVGFSVPAGDTDVKLTEVFCRYWVTNEAPGDEIEMMNGGYKLYIPDTKKWIKSQHTPEDSVWHTFTIDTVMFIDDERYIVTNQVIVQDMTDLERSTTCESLSRYLNKTT